MDENAKLVLQRYPRITAHLIAESLGYFSPSSAAIAVLRYKQGEAMYCELYSSIVMGQHGQKHMYDRSLLTKTTKEYLRFAIKNRHSHRSSMGSYHAALSLVRQDFKDGRSNRLASWF